jgi:hypothetical protein
MTTERYSRSIPLESFARHLGFGSLANRLPFAPSVLTTWALVFVFVDVVVLQAYKEAMGYPATFLLNPALLISPTFALLAAASTAYLYARYDRVLDLIAVESRTSEPERFRQLSPSWVRRGLYTIGVVFFLYTAIDNDPARMYEIGGLAEVVGSLVVLPVGYIPVFVEFLTVYLGIMLFLPRTIRDTDFSVHFLDPEGLGGLRPIGEFVKYAYYFVMVGLIGFALATYGPYVLDGVLSYEELSPPGTTVNVLFTLVWAAAVAVMAYGIYVLHRFMRREKREELFRLESKARDALEEPYDLVSFDAADPPDVYAQHRERVERVTSTKEYPASFTMWTQLVVGVLIPKAIQLVLASI